MVWRERNKLKDDFSSEDTSEWKTLGNYGQNLQGNGLIRYGDAKFNKWWVKRIIGRFYCHGSTFGAPNNGNYVCQGIEAGENLILTKEVQKLLKENGNSVSQMDLKSILPFDPKSSLPNRVIIGYNNPFLGSYTTKGIKYTGTISNSDIIVLTYTICPTDMKGNNVLSGTYNCPVLIGGRNNRNDTGCHGSAGGALGVWFGASGSNFRIWAGQQCLSSGLIYSHYDIGSYKAHRAENKNHMYGNITLADYNNAPRIDRGYGRYVNSSYPYPLKGYYKIRVVHFNSDSRIRILVRPLSKIDTKRKQLCRHQISYVCACLPRNPLDVNAQFTIFDTMKRRWPLQGAVTNVTKNHPNKNITGEMLPHDKVKNFKNGLCRIKMHDGRYLGYNKNGYTSGPPKDGYIWNVEVIYDEGPGNNQTVIIISNGGQYLRWGSGNNVDLSQTRNQCNWRLYSNRIKYNEYKYRATLARENQVVVNGFYIITIILVNYVVGLINKHLNLNFISIHMEKKEFLLYPSVQLRHVEGAALQVYGDGGEMRASYWYTNTSGNYIDNNWYYDNTFALFKWPNGKVAFRSNRNGKYIYDHGGGKWGYVRATSGGPGAGEDSRIIEITGTPWEAGGEVVIDFGRTGYLAGGIPVWMDSSKHGADWTNRANLLNSNYRNYYETDMQEEDGSYWDWYEDKPYKHGRINGGPVSFRTAQHNKGTELYRGILGDVDIRIYNSSWYLKRSWPTDVKQGIYGTGQLLNIRTGTAAKGSDKAGGESRGIGLGRELLVGYSGPNPQDTRSNNNYSTNKSHGGWHVNSAFSHRTNHHYGWGFL